MASEAATSTSSTPLKPVRLKVLPHRLVLAALQHNQLPSCSYALLKLLLFPESDDLFFSYTDTSDCISLVIEDQVLPQFPAESLQCTTQRWRAIKFDEGPLGFEATGIVSSIATPLAQAKICLYYVDTYTTGYTLVEENMLEEAVECLKEAGFTFSNDSDIPKQSSPKSDTTKSPMSPNSTTNTQMVIAKLPFKVNMASLAKGATKQYSRSLIQLLLYPNVGKRFFSYTETPDEISLVLDTQAAKVFPEGILTLNNSCWQVLQICEGSYGASDGSETISKFAKPLADASISIFNVSTYFNDYTLIGEENVEKSVEELKKCLNIIFEEEELEL